MPRRKLIEIRKAVITAAGWGTRFLPVTKAQPKEMVPLVDKPVIQWIVEEVVASGINHIIIVTARGKQSIEDHFDRSLELEHALEEKGKATLLDEVRRISELADICYVRQKEQLGLGHAILTAESIVGSEPFAVFLPDDIIESPVPCMKQMLEVYHRYQGNIVAIKEVGLEDTRRYGIIQPKKVADRVYQVMDVVEKPEPEAAPSLLAIVGRYILMPQIFDALKVTPRGTGQEIQLTDALKLLLKQQPIYGYEFDGTRYDVGNPLGWLEASVALALHRDFGDGSFHQYLRRLTTNL